MISCYPTYYFTVHTMQWRVHCTSSKTALTMLSYSGRVNTSSTTVAQPNSTSTKLVTYTIRFHKTQVGQPVWYQRRHRTSSTVDKRHRNSKIRADHSDRQHPSARARVHARSLPCCAKAHLQFKTPHRASFITSNSDTVTDTCCSHVDIRPHSRSLDLEH